MAGLWGQEIYMGYLLYERLCGARVGRMERSAQAI